MILDRKKVLKHHPDKKVSTVTQNNTYSYLGLQNTNDDAFFKCIQKAYEVLTHPEKRRQFDSVDPVVLDLEDDAPTASEFKASADFTWHSNIRHYPGQGTRLLQNICANF